MESSLFEWLNILRITLYHAPALTGQDISQIQVKVIFMDDILAGFILADILW